MTVQVGADVVAKICGEGAHLGIGIAFRREVLVENRTQLIVIPELDIYLVVEREMIAHVVCVAPLLDGVAAAKLSCHRTRLTVLVYVITVGVAQPQVSGDDVLGLVVLIALLERPILFQRLKQRAALVLERADSLPIILAFVEEGDEHGPHILGRCCCELGNHPLWKIVHRREKIFGLGERPCEHLRKVGGVDIPIVLKVLDCLPLVLLVLPGRRSKIDLVQGEYFSESFRINHCCSSDRSVSKQSHSSPTASQTPRVSQRLLSSITQKNRVESLSRLKTLARLCIGHAHKPTEIREFGHDTPKKPAIAPQAETRPRKFPSPR